MTTEALCIIGCGGHARSVADVAIAGGERDILFIDNAARPGETILGFPVLTFAALASRRLVLRRYVVALGDNAARAREFERLRSVTGIPAVRVIAPDARRGRDDRLGDGVFVGAAAHLGPEASIGDNTIVNTRAIVEHEVVVGAHSHVSVNAVLAGRVRIGERVFVGVGTVVVDGVHVCDDVVIGAGAVVIASIERAGTYVGVPARPVSPGDHTGRIHR